MKVGVAVVHTPATAATMPVHLSTSPSPAVSNLATGGGHPNTPSRNPLQISPPLLLGKCTTCARLDGCSRHASRHGRGTEAHSAVSPTRSRVKPQRTGQEAHVYKRTRLAVAQLSHSCRGGHAPGHGHSASGFSPYLIAACPRCRQ